MRFPLHTTFRGYLKYASALPHDFLSNSIRATYLNDKTQTGIDEGLKLLSNRWGNFSYTIGAYYEAISVLKRFQEHQSQQLWND